MNRGKATHDVIAVVASVIDKHGAINDQIACKIPKKKLQTLIVRFPVVLLTQSGPYNSRKERST